MSIRDEDPNELIEISKKGRSIVIHIGCTLFVKENGYDSKVIRAFPFVIRPSGEKNNGDFSCD